MASWPPPSPQGGRCSALQFSSAARLNTDMIYANLKPGNPQSCNLQYYNLQPQCKKSCKFSVGLSNACLEPVRSCASTIDQYGGSQKRDSLREVTMEAATASMQAVGDQRDAYAAIPTLPVASALAGSGSEMGELSGRACRLLDRPNKKQVRLFYCSETEDLARRVAAESDSIELKSIRWETFADGFPNLFVPNAHGIRSQHVAFLASFSSPGVIFEQLSIIYALPRMFVLSFTLVLPFFPTGTLERMEDEGDIATAFTLARILSNIPISRGGPTSLVIFDIHALQERFYFGDNVLPCFETGIPLLKYRLHQLPDSNNVSIAFPDEGAWKRFHKQLQHFPTIICTKVRDGNNRIVRLKEGDPNGRHVVIVDDLVQSGGTLIECQKLLGAMGAAKVSAYATHGVFPKRSWERFHHDNGEGPEHGFANFWITDSCPNTVKEIMGRPPFEVLSLAGSIAAALHI